MSKVIVISQPMFFPWIGLFEQIKLSNIFVHYDDVQLPQGRSFTNRVQIKSKDGIIWLTVPLKRESGKGLIKEAQIASDLNWKDKHLKILAGNYAKAPFKNEMLDLVNDVYSNNFEKISDLNIYSLELICKYLGLWEGKDFYKSSDLGFQSVSSQKLLDTVRYFHGDVYVTGLGALNYIDYNLFEDSNIRIEYMDYQKLEYPQNFGDFTPYVSILDAIAYHGTNAQNYIQSKSKYWKEYING